MTSPLDRLRGSPLEPWCGCLRSDLMMASDLWGLRFGPSSEGTKGSGPKASGLGQAHPRTSLRHMSLGLYGSTFGPEPNLECLPPIFVQLFGPTSP
ncbi:hypothetical protein GUJ93_ZPchr0010g8840 [Zizania palustris]|uniref:Uncharacterized protein n=1 Tax=Zizania palustris TaxID=103762 RepID=A0A8J6BRN8_ZIZPA|nr:hypothetical protein GUJ93_ZPchr0010g8840 [Zizania palustris]